MTQTASRKLNLKSCHRRKLRRQAEAETKARERKETARAHADRLNAEAMARYHRDLARYEAQQNPRLDWLSPVGASILRPVPPFLIPVGDES